MTLRGWILVASLLSGLAITACGNDRDGEDVDAGGAGSGGDLAGATGGAASGGTASLGGSGGSASGGTPGEEIPKMKVVMYLPNWSGSYADWAEELDFERMTHLNLAFGTIDGNSNDWTLGASDGDVEALVAAAHAANVKVLVSIGGASDDIGIINRYENAANIAPMVANLYALVERLGLDGVDVDVERGGDMTSDGNFGQFVDELRTTLKAHDKQITAALAQYVMEEAGDDEGVAAWVADFDFINLMIYVTNFDTYVNESAWWTDERNVPADKLTLGVLFTNEFSPEFVQQVTDYSKDYGGIMAWELSMDKASTLWPAIQDEL